MSRAAPSSERDFRRGLGLFDATMVVVGTMIGSGIFIVSADMARLLGSSGWLLASWGLTGLLTVGAALAYGELAAMLPRAGGQYVFLREAYSPMVGFLYGWTLFSVIQTGFIAAVSVAFARFTGVLWPWIAEDHYLLGPWHLSTGYAVSLSTAQLLALSLIASLTWTNMRGLEYGRVVQNVFTVAKTGAVLALVALGLFWGWNSTAVSANFTDMWAPRGPVDVVAGLSAASVGGLFVAMCIAQVGSLFSSDAWHNICFSAAEVREAERVLPRAMVLGTVLVTALYLLVNLAYLVTLPLSAIQTAPSDRVATLVVDTVLPGVGAPLMAAAIMISTFGCVNALVLAGARAYFAMAKDGLFFAAAGRLSATRVPAFGLVLQGVWAACMVLPRTFDPATGQYGNLYGNLLDYVVSSTLLFYVLTVGGLFRLRASRPDAPRPYRAFGYPWVPALYIAAAATILAVLFIYRPATTWPGMVIVASGIPLYYVAVARAEGRR